ncbi:MAG: hypothetical protein U0361_04200 [Nitrospiraceae bacterium]
MDRIFGRPLVTQEQMRTRIRELGRQIAADYAGKDLVLLGVLKGAYAFYADLARAIRIPLRVDHCRHQLRHQVEKLGEGQTGVGLDRTGGGERRITG